MSNEIEKLKAAAEEEARAEAEAARAATAATAVWEAARARWWKAWDAYHALVNADK